MSQTKVKTTPWDVQNHLRSDEECSAFLAACFDEAGDDAAFIAQAIGEVARAKGMMQIARETGMAREALYRSLSANGNPTLSTLLKVLHSLGLQLTSKPVSERD